MSNIMTICGSMRFLEDMLEIAENRTLAGEIVLMPFVIVTSDDNSDTKVMLDALHFEKIFMSDSIVVVTNNDLYIGESTNREIWYAKSIGIPINYVYKDRNGIFCSISYENDDA